MSRPQRAFPAIHNAINRTYREITMRTLRGANSPRVHVPSLHQATRRILAACTFGATLISVSANAQQAPAATEAPTTELQEIVVTGSMIKRVNAETAEAITILKADDLRDLGVTNVEGVMNQLTGNNTSVNTATTVGTFS